MSDHPIAFVPLTAARRLLPPASRAVQPELLPIAGRPALARIIDETVAAGFTRLILAAGRGVSSIRTQLDVHFGPPLATTSNGTSLPIRGYVSSEGAAFEVILLKNWHPASVGELILSARELLDRDFFALVLPNIVYGMGSDLLVRMRQVQEHSGRVVLAKTPTPACAVSEAKISLGPEGTRADIFIEPAPQASDPDGNRDAGAPGGRYLLNRQLLAALDTFARVKGAGDPFFAALAQLSRQHPLSAVAPKDPAFDCAEKAGFIAANLSLALDDDALNKAVSLEFVRTGLRERLNAFVDVDVVEYLTRAMTDSARR